MEYILLGGIAHTCNPNREIEEGTQFEDRLGYKASTLSQEEKKKILIFLSCGIARIGFFVCGFDFYGFSKTGKNVGTCHMTLSCMSPVTNQHLLFIQSLNLILEKYLFTSFTQSVGFLCVSY